MKSVCVKRVKPLEKYPYLGRWSTQNQNQNNPSCERHADAGDFIVFFTVKGEGVVVYTENEGHALGSFAKWWDETQFEPFVGVIELTN